VYFLHFLPKFEIGHSFQFQNYIIVVSFSGTLGKKASCNYGRILRGLVSPF
jgi:hypothetical protein